MAEVYDGTEYEDLLLIMRRNTVYMLAYGHWVRTICIDILTP
jgi:hypothetical protein